MLTSLKAKGFAALPYLETSTLMATHDGQVKFSNKKPNVIIGPNGSGKSALLRSISIRFLAHLTSRSTFNRQYLQGRSGEDWWSRDREWGNDYTFLKGLEVKTDGGPVLFYRPAHIPGNEADVTHSMMTGYFEEARHFARLTENKSSGQMSQALLAEMLQALAGDGLPLDYAYADWGYGTEARTLERFGGFNGPTASEYKAEILRAMVKVEPNAVPLVLMDEPEQSLDALAEAQLWGAIAAADCSRLQVIVATHSLYPMLHPKRFNLIEAEPGYLKRVTDLMA